MSIARVVTPRASTLSRVAGSLKRAIPQTSLSAARDCASPNAIRPAGPVMSTFSPRNTPRSVYRIFDPNQWCAYDGRVGADVLLEQAILDSLDGLLRALELEPVGGDRF